MLFCEIIMLVLIALTCIISSYTDIKANRVYNKVLIAIIISGIAVSVIYYSCFAWEYVIDFSINLALILVLSLLLYFTHVWAGGDTKLLIVVCFLIPARLYLSMNGNNITVALVIVISFIFGYIYLITDSIITGFRCKQVAKPKEFATAIIRFVKNYIVLANYMLSICLLNILVLSRYIELDYAMYIILGLCMVAFVSRFSFLKRWFVVTPVFVANLTLVIIFRVRFGGISYWSYLFVLVFEAIRILVSKYNYEEIATCDVKPGMILSATSSMMINMTHLKDVPSISKEDQRNRLTKSEATSVIQWGKSRFGTDKIIIVRKVPFAVFIALGTIVYIIIGGYILWF